MTYVVVDLTTYQARVAAEEAGRRTKPEKLRATHSAMPVNSERGAAYARCALDGACRDVESAPEGARNNTLFRRAARLNSMAAAGMVVHDEVEHALRAAAERSGLDSREINKTLESAARNGREKPFDLGKLRPLAPEPAQQRPDKPVLTKPHYPAASEARDVALERQERAIENWFKKEILRSRVKQEAQQRGQEYLAAEGLTDPMFDAEAWGVKAEELRRRDLATEQVELEKLQTEEARLSKELATAERGVGESQQGTAPPALSEGSTGGAERT